MNDRPKSFAAWAMSTDRETGSPGRASSLLVATLLLGVALLIIALLQLWLNTNPSRQVFASTNGRIDIAAGVEAPARQEEGGAVLDRGEVMSFRPVSLEANTQYLLVVRATKGLRFSLLAGDQPTGQRLAFNMARRLETTETHRSFSLEKPAERLRFRARLPTASRLVLEELTLYPLSPMYRWLRSGLPWLRILLIVAFVVVQRRNLMRALRSPRPVDDVVLALVVFAVCFTVFQRGQVHQMLDSRYLSAVSHSILHTGRASLPENFWPADRVDRDYQLQDIDGKIYHFFPAAPAILNVPVVAAFEAFGVASVSERGRFDRGRELLILRTAAALVAAALCGLLYCIGRLFLPPPKTLGLVLLFAFGTQIYSTISRPFWSHGWAVCLMAAALYLLIAPRPAKGRATMALAATLLSWSFFSRPTMSLSILAILALLLYRREKHIPTFIVTGAAWASLFVARSMVLFGSVVPPYFSQSNYQSGRAAEDLLSRYPTAILGTLFSPSRGLFIFVPLFAWILWMAVVRRRRLPSLDLAVVSIAVILVHWQVLSFFGNWTGGQCYGPRLFSDVVVWFFVLATLVLAARPAERRSGWRSSLAVASLAIVAVVSVFINYRGATAKETWDWRPFERPPRWVYEDREPLLEPPGVWNWRYPQFTAGLLPIDRKLDRRWRRGKPPSRPALRRALHGRWSFRNGASGD